MTGKQALLIAIAATISAVSGGVLAAQGQASLEQARQVAGEELKRMTQRALLGPRGGGPGGLPESATLGQPYREYFIRLDQLKDFKSGQDTNKLLSGGTDLVFPALVESPGGLLEVKSSIVVGEQQPGSWHFVSNNHPLAGVISDLVTSKIPKKTAPGSSQDAVAAVFSVHVLALNKYYIGRRKGSELWLQALDDKMNLVGEERKASVVLCELVPQAKLIDPRYPN